MIKFIGGEAQVGHTDRNLPTSLTTSGSTPLDKMKNIYDLEENYFEWTAEADIVVNRVVRGGYYFYLSNGNYFYPASHEYTSNPTSAYSYNSSRAALIVAL